MTHQESSNPTHWTYEKIVSELDLQQGNILDATDNIRGLCKRIHPYFCDQKFLGFMVITQSCDLVRRKGKCNAQYINLAVIRSIDDILPTLLDSVCISVAPYIYTYESKGEANKLLSRIFNQNEQALGLFYLHPDVQAGVAVPSVVLLRVSVSFRAEHYETLRSARRGALTPEFRSKLGWLTGNLFSRVGTKDWSESTDGQKKLNNLIDSFLNSKESQLPHNLPLWVNKSWAEAAHNNGESLDQLKREDIVSTISKYAPSTPKEDIIKSVVENIKSIIPEIEDEIIIKIEKRLSNNGNIAAALKRARLEKT